MPNPKTLFRKAPKSELGRVFDLIDGQRNRIHEEIEKLDPVRDEAERNAFVMALLVVSHLRQGVETIGGEL